MENDNHEQSSISTVWMKYLKEGFQGIKDELTPDLLKEEAMMLLYGDNMFGDPVYTYASFSLEIL
jgi:hypothetical protein